MADDAKKPLAEGDNLGVESTTTSPETENVQGDAVEQAADEEPSDEQVAAEMGALSEAGGR